MGKLAELLQHPNELIPMMCMYVAQQQTKRLPKDPDLSFCFKLLHKVSRSFAVVISQLEEELRYPVAIFYLVLRALDTIEDDMSIPVEEKLPMLRNFYNSIMDANFKGSYGEGHYRELMEEFPKVHRAILRLNGRMIEVIIEHTKAMGEGMAIFIEKEVITRKDFDEYCHYVAGIVGIGLSNLFVSSGLESEKFLEMEDLANHMGLFLQKTNILRDYLEDIMEEPAPRMFWPRDVWSLYTTELDNFKHPDNRSNALKCLNHLFVETLSHVPYCLHYLEVIKTPSVFKFCAIPQIMAIATTEICFNNGEVFEKEVKIRRGLTCKIFGSSQSIQDVYLWFELFLNQIAKKIPEVEMDDAIRKKALASIEEINEAIARGKKKFPAKQQTFISTYWMVCVLIIALLNTFVVYTFDDTSKSSVMFRWALNIFLFLLFKVLDPKR